MSTYRGFGAGSKWGVRTKLTYSGLGVGSR